MAKRDAPRRRQKPNWVKDLALKRIRRLFDLAEQELEVHPDRTRRYVELARKLSTKYNTTIAKELKEKMGKQCNSLLIEGKSMRVEQVSKVSYALAVCVNCMNAKKRFLGSWLRQQL